MKKSLVMFSVFAVVFILAFSFVFAAQKFSDVPVGYWAYKSVERMTNEGIIKGYSDGTFRPDNSITRAEFVTILSRLFEPEKVAKLDGYVDVDGNAWYYNDLAKVVELGAIKGDSDTQMRPEANISREEAVVILNRILELQYSEVALSKHFTDIRNLSSWAEDDVLAFIENGFMNGYEDGSLRPRQAITRAEVVRLLDMAIADIITSSGEHDMTGKKGVVIVKSPNVVLKNTEGVIRVIAINENQKDTFKGDNIAKEDVSVINAGNGTKKSTGAAGGSSAPKKIEIKINDSGDMYKVTRNAVTISNGKKMTVLLNGDPIVENVVVGNTDTFKEALRTIIDQLDVKRVFYTLDDTEKYDGYQARGKEVFTWGVAILGELGLYQEAAELTVYPSENIIKDIYDVIDENKKVDQVKDAAWATLEESISYEDGLKVLNNL